MISIPTVPRERELANTSQTGIEGFWWLAVETWTTWHSSRAFHGGIQISLAACASARNAETIAGTAFPMMLLGGQLCGPLLRGRTGLIEA